jgi:tellurite resistance protein
MNEESAQAIVTIAAIAAMADGVRDPQEQAQIADAAARLGVPLDEVVLADGASAPIEAAKVARRLTTNEARVAAYQVAVAVCNADGYANTRESLFLQSLAKSLDVDASQIDAESATTAKAIDGWLSAGSGAAAGAAFAAGAGATGAGATAAGATGAASSNTGSLDDFILNQALLSAALELLPDRLANLGIIPLQMRLVHIIGQRSGATDGPHVQELMATLGIGVAAQVMESVVRKTFGGLAGGLLGGLFGGVAGTAAGGAVTFATTYALGHAAQQYYAQGRSMSSGDFKALFTKLKQDATTMYPRVQGRVSEIARGNSLQSIMQQVRGEMA